MDDLTDFSSENIKTICQIGHCSSSVNFLGRSHIALTWLSRHSTGILDLASPQNIHKSHYYIHRLNNYLHYTYCGHHHITITLLKLNTEMARTTTIFVCTLIWTEIRTFATILPFWWMHFQRVLVARNVKLWDVLQILYGTKFRVVTLKHISTLDYDNSVYCLQRYLVKIKGIWLIPSRNCEQWKVNAIATILRFKTYFFVSLWILY